jgi:hypothetical protein
MTQAGGRDLALAGSLVLVSEYRLKHISAFYFITPRLGEIPSGLDQIHSVITRQKLSL